MILNRTRDSTDRVLMERNMELRLQLNEALREIELLRAMLPSEFDLAAAAATEAFNTKEAA